VTTSTVDNVCVDGEDGIIFVDVANAPDAILLGDYQGQQVFESEDGVFSGLLSGTYLIHVEDTAGCTTSVVVEINDPTSSALTLTASSTPDDGSESGTITAVPSGGVPPYTVDIYDADGNEVADAYLPAGDYFVTVQDDLGCSVTVPVTVESSVAVVDVDGASMVLYPNPTRGMIEIKNLPLHWASLHVLDVTGREMLAVQPSATATVQWDASGWPVGAYFVQVVGHDGLITKRFSVVR